MPNGSLDDHCRNYLPHIERKLCQMITFRLYDSVPSAVVRQWKEQLNSSREGKDVTTEERNRRLLTLIDNYEDAGYGSCLLRDEGAAEIVRDSLYYYNEKKYRLLAWCLMPNHVHVLILQLSDTPLSDILHGWRSYTSRRINKLMHRTGKVWMTEYFDRFIRDPKHFNTAVKYIHNNPVKAGLCSSPSQYRWSSAYQVDDV